MLNGAGTVSHRGRLILASSARDGTIGAYTGTRTAAVMEW